MSPPYCIECGSEIDDSWNACPNCGKVVRGREVTPPQPIAPPSPPQPPQQPNPYRTQPYQRSYATGGQSTYGVVALVCGIVGLFCGGIIFGIVAIIMGGMGLNRDENTGAAIIGLVLGIIDVACFFIAWFWLFSWFAWPFPY
jgi:hypothetical protein